MNDAEQQTEISGTDIYLMVTLPKFLEKTVRTI